MTLNFGFFLNLYGPDGFDQAGGEIERKKAAWLSVFYSSLCLCVWVATLVLVTVGRHGNVGICFVVALCSPLLFLFVLENFHTYTQTQR